MSVVFHGALVAYPLYQTSKHVLTSEDSENRQATTMRWLHFWLVFGGFQMLEDVGADKVPFFYLLEAAVLLSMYSAEHATLIGSLLPKLCQGYISGVDKAHKWWNEKAITQLDESQRSWLSSGWSKAQSIGSSVVSLFYGAKSSQSEHEKDA